jgi:hypothetical protein
MFKQPSFDLEQYMIPMKGGKKYLPVAPRIAWLREVYPDAQVDIELVFHDPDAKLAVARARVVIRPRAPPPPTTAAKRLKISTTIWRKAALRPSGAR